MLNYADLKCGSIVEVVLEGRAAKHYGVVTDLDQREQQEFLDGTQDTFLFSALIYLPTAFEHRIFKLKQSDIVRFANKSCSDAYAAAIEESEYFSEVIPC